MCNQNEWIVREAFLAYDRGDVARMLEFIDPDLEWTYFEPGLDDARPQAYGGRDELEQAVRRQVQQGVRSELEEASTGTGSSRATTGPMTSSPCGTG